MRSMSDTLHKQIEMFVWCVWTKSVMCGLQADINLLHVAAHKCVYSAMSGMAVAGMSGDYAMVNVP